MTNSRRTLYLNGVENNVCWRLPSCQGPLIRWVLISQNVLCRIFTRGPHNLDFLSLGVSGPPFEKLQRELTVGQMRGFQVWAPTVDARNPA